MTLHDKPNIILIQYRAGKGMEEEGGHPDPAIAAIIQAVEERLPVEDTMPVLDDSTEVM